VGALVALARRQSATIPPSKGHPSGRFPMPDRKHARLALQMLPRAQGMSARDRAAVRNRATRMLRRGR
jgi:hypothetical protein